MTAAVVPGCAPDVTDAPAGLPRPFGAAERIVHLDLHPGNVMLTAGGPVVIDWTNVAAGPPGAVTSGAAGRSGCTILQRNQLR